MFLSPRSLPSCPRISRRSALTAAGAGLFSATVLSGCNDSSSKDDAVAAVDDPDPNINPKGMPVVKDRITLTMLTRRSPNTAENWDDVANVEAMEKLSNVHVDWGFVPWEEGAEKRNLALASGDYPEVLHRTDMGAVDIAKYGEQGTLMALNPIIDEYMPHLTALLEDNPDIRKGLTFPDGNIYSLPTIAEPDFDSMNMQQKLWVREDWLDDFGMDIPTTLDEFEAFLDEVKHRTPVGDGSKAAIPYSTGGAGLFVQMLHSTFGLANKGFAVPNLDTDDNGDLRFWRTSDAYRDLLEYLSRLYSKKLIQQDIFSIDQAKFDSLGKQGVFGAVGSQSPKAFFGKVGESYVSIPPLRRAAGDDIPSWNLVGSPLKAIGQFVLTDKAAHGIEACRWMDHYFSEEGARLFYMGVEGKSYDKTDDGYRLLPEITDNPDGLTPDEALRPYVTYLGGACPGLITSETFQGTENSEQAKKGTEAVAPYRIKDVWAPFTYAADEADELTSISTDIDKLIEESEAQFITGKRPLSDWDAYVEQFSQIGLDRFMEIQQGAFERFMR